MGTVLRRDSVAIGMAAPVDIANDIRIDIGDNVDRLVQRLL